MASEYGTREWWDEHRAGSYGGYKGGYSSADDPYLGEKQWERDRDAAARRSAADQRGYEARRRKAAEEEATRLRNMTPSERIEYRNQQRAEQERREYYSGMTPAQRSLALEREAELREYNAAMEKMEHDKQERENRREAFDNAKKSYKSLNVCTKVALKLSGKAPNNMNYYKMDVEEIEQLYRR